jgi:hypothetical protein
MWSVDAKAGTVKKGSLCLEPMVVRVVFWADRDNIVC